MKIKRIFSLLLSVCLLCGLMTVGTTGASAEQPTRVLNDFDTVGEYSGVVVSNTEASVVNYSEIDSSYTDGNVMKITNTNFWPSAGFSVDSSWADGKERPIALKFQMWTNVAHHLQVGYSGIYTGTSEWWANPNYLSFSEDESVNLGAWKLEDFSIYAKNVHVLNTEPTWYTYDLTKLPEDYTGMLRMCWSLDRVSNPGDVSLYVDNITLVYPEEFTVTIDGANPTVVTEGKNFTFPTMDGVEKYTIDGETYYSAGDTYTVTGDIDFTTVYRAVAAEDFAVIADHEYTGEAIEPELTSDTLTADDYEVSYADNTNAGTATVTVTGKGHYYGTAEITFEITPKAVTAENFVIDTENKVYTGSAITPQVNSDTLTADDYEVSYADNTNVGTATITIAGKGNYSGEVTKTFNITAKAITAEDFVIDTENKVYTGSAITPDVNSDTLTDDDYEVSYADNTNVGVATITVTGKGNYNGEVAESFEITPKAITEDDFTFVLDDAEFTGEAITPEVTSTLGEDDYEVVYSDNINAGTATIAVNGKGNYGETITKTFTITAKAFEETDFGEIESRVYTGTEIVPAVTVENELISENDYEVACENNENVGTATITITGKRNFVGTVNRTFEITTKEIAEEDFTFDVADKVYTGQAIAPAVTAESLKEADFEVAYSDNTNVGTATITVTGKGNTTGTVTKTFAITAKAITDADFTVDTADVVHTGSAITKEVKSTLPADAYTVAYANNTAVGTATITITGKGNYQGTITKTFKITEKKVETPAPDEDKDTKVEGKKPAKVKKVTAKSKAKKKVTVTWKAAKNAKKYIVKYSYKKNMKKAKTKTVKKLKVTLKKLKSGKKVYIQVQAVNGKLKGKLSAKKSVKVK